MSGSVTPPAGAGAGEAPTTPTKAGPVGRSGSDFVPGTPPRAGSIEFTERVLDVLQAVSDQGSGAHVDAGLRSHIVYTMQNAGEHMRSLLTSLDNTTDEGKRIQLLTDVRAIFDSVNSQVQEAILGDIARDYPILAQTVIPYLLGSNDGGSE